MTNAVNNVNNSPNKNNYNNNIGQLAGVAFSSVLKTKMNSAAASIGNFDTDVMNGSSNDSGSNMGGLNDLLNFNNGGLSNGLGSKNSAGKMDSQTIVAFLFLLMAMGGEGESGGSSAMISSFTDALMGGNRQSTYGGLLNNSRNNALNDLSFTGSSYKATPISPGTGSIPASMGKRTSPAIVNNVGNRNPNAYSRVVSQFNVEKNPRYTPYKNGSTYCNIFVWDVTSAMGAEIPHRVDKNGDIAKEGSGSVKYMTANSMYDWLGGKGKEYGWKEVSAEEAQRYANMGSPAVSSWKNPKGHGHIQMVVPSKDGRYNPTKGVAISQAGSKVIENGYITDVFKGSKLKEIKYFVHA